MKTKITLLVMGIVLFTLFQRSALGIDLYFEAHEVHDPSTIQNDNGQYWTFGTGDGILTRYSDDLLSWQIGDRVFPIGTWPAWINDSVPGFNGQFWAPDVIFMNGKYYLYYSCYAEINGGTDFNAAIGVAVSTSLNAPSWTDLGMVVSSMTEPVSSQGFKIGCIDPGLFRDAGGNVWMVYGSYWGGIYMLQIDPATGKRVNSTRYPVAGNNGGWSTYEAAQVTYINGYYYLFVNNGSCCQGNQSTYHILMGRSSSLTGPYLDQNGINLWNNGGTILLATDGNYIGPGHYGYYNNNGQHLVSIHYYDGTTVSGWPSRLDLLEMSFANGWPVLTRNFTIPGSSAPIPVSANLVDGGTFPITAGHSGKNLEVRRKPNGSCPNIGNGTNVEQGVPDSSTCQQWIFKRMRDKDGNVDPYYWTIHPAGNPAQAVEIFNVSPLDGANVGTWSFQNESWQQFRLVDKGSGYYQILCRMSGKVLNVAGSSSANGANVEQWRANDWLSQQFTFGGSGGGTATSMHVASILVGTENAGMGKKRGTATVTILDDQGSPVNAATVTGTFSGSFNETQSGATGPDGKVTLKTAGTQSGSVSVVFCVDGVAHATLTYDPAQNTVACAGP